MPKRQLAFCAFFPAPRCGGGGLHRRTPDNIAPVVALVISIGWRALLFVIGCDEVWMLADTFFLLRFLLGTLGDTFIRRGCFGVPFGASLPTAYFPFSFI